jgi:hypothetical protein
MVWPSRYVPLSPPRRLMRDLIACAPMSNIMGGTGFINVTEVAAIRRRHQPLIGWGLSS